MKKYISAVSLLALFGFGCVSHTTQVVETYSCHSEKEIEHGYDAAKTAEFFAESEQEAKQARLAQSFWMNEAEHPSRCGTRKSVSNQGMF